MSYSAIEDRKPLKMAVPSSEDETADEIEEEFYPKNEEDY